jgi:hypothetical protein
MSTVKYLIALSLVMSAMVACAPTEEEQEDGSVEGGGSLSKALYVASGVCYSGMGNTTFTSTTASNIVFRINLSTGAHEADLADYNVVSETPGNTPIGIQNYDADNVLVLVENTTSTGNRRLEKIPKNGAHTKSTFTQNSTIFTATSVLRTFIKNPTDGTFLVSRGAAVEKVNSTGARQLSGGSQPWLSATSGTCQSNTNITALALLSNEKMVFSHANTAQNRFGIIAAAGYANTPANCLSVQAAPQAAAFPTAMVYLPASHQLLVAYAGNTTTADINSIYAYDIDETTNAITGATKAYENANVLYGVSAMAVDAETGHIYVATAVSTATTVGGYNIEKFTFNPTTKTLTRATTTPFSTHTFKTKCISSMFVGQ